ncbi:hypothetical protein PR202_ga21690 [Eleusine coracana subsp. coracana]|uniref:Transcription factor n=1 Tax=Eleusine coracana subsp. coracana TaxID=191504 RepID=A0AAV5D159_ELECO|nr:hypothetical protein QOZ80_8AG0639440 [Eleusine coracana subsp. coracana]GJN04166.1 hypothetical protein PR202_ga21690 [Eleusine coracana subsp. coracana]
MDELFGTTSSGSPSSPASFFSVDGGRPPVLEFEACDIPEQLWLGDDDHDGLVVDKRSAGSNDNDQSSGEPPAPAGKKRGRKPGWSSRKTDDPALSHVEAERQRREKLNRRFCDLRAAVPTVSRMDKASLLADATAYIAELRGRVEKLEAEAAQKAAPPAVPSPFGLPEEEEKLEVRMVGRDAAALRLTSAARHAPARLMEALRVLDLAVQHATVCRAGGVTVLDAVVDVPAGPLQDVAWLRAALIHRLQGSACRSFFQMD